MSDSLWPHDSKQARPPCPSPTPGVHSNSGPLSRWCHPAISSSVLPFSSCPQSLPASGSFPMSQVFTSGGQSIGVSASQSVLPKNTQDWSLEWTGWCFIYIDICQQSMALLFHTLSAAAKSLQLCPTLCSPRYGSLPGFPVPGILQARTLEWVAISFSNNGNATQP